MEYVDLGRTHEKISRIGLGAWQFSEAWGVTEYMQARAVISKAVELGVNFFDTAMVYGLGLSENLLGKALRELGVRRDDVFITTKIPGDFLSPADIYRSVEKSIEVLGLGYIDGLLVHWPPCWHNIPTRIYARALEKLVFLGRVRYLGLSNFPIELVESFRSALAKHDVEIFQIRYNLVERWADEEIVPYAEKHSITIQAWSPLAKGALTGKYNPENLPKFTDVRAREAVFHPENFNSIWRLVQLLKSIGERYGKTPTQVALNWLTTASPVIVPIPGAKTPEQVMELVDSVGWKLSYSDWITIDELSKKIAISYSAYYLDYKPQ
ncbi:MAG: aldo/keto reductase [Ignisphaera sp.]|uniref:Aldo/keto reductase n=1 Tax=Ignisphaera aggregans TaxID=334771 RepID=A0A7J3JS35_9CREN